MNSMMSNYGCWHYVKKRICYHQQGEKHGRATMGVDGCTVATAAVYFQSFISYNLSNNL